MARFYFNLREGNDLLLDPEGCVLPDLAAVADKAMRAARAMLSADVLEGRMSLDMRLDVADENGIVIHSLAFPQAIEIVRPR